MQHLILKCFTAEKSQYINETSKHNQTRTTWKGQHEMAKLSQSVKVGFDRKPEPAKDLEGLLTMLGPIKPEPWDVQHFKNKLMHFILNPEMKRKTAE